MVWGHRIRSILRRYSTWSSVVMVVDVIEIRRALLILLRRISLCGPPAQFPPQPSRTCLRAHLIATRSAISLRCRLLLKMTTFFCDATTNQSQLKCIGRMRQTFKIDLRTESRNPRGLALPSKIVECPKASVRASTNSEFMRKLACVMFHL